MRVLIVKTSSMGDVIHTLPALTDAVRAIPNIRFDWVVEEGFAEIPAWHPAVDQVIPIAWRRWRKKLSAPETRAEIKAFVKRLRERDYDLVIDAQGLVKSALLTRLARGRSAGLDWSSARESVASLFYQKRCTVNFYQHAILRMRSIFALLLNYDRPESVPDYGVPRAQFLADQAEAPYLVFLHGTTWDTKLWPEENWSRLAKKAAEEGLSVKLLWGNRQEEERAQRLAQGSPNITVMPRQDLKGSATILANAHAVIAVDTGFAHLAAALDVPGVSMYGATNPHYSGALGRKQICLAASFPCSPCLKRECTYQGKATVAPACFSAVPPEKVWESLKSLF